MSTAAYSDLVERLTNELLAQTARANRYEAALRLIADPTALPPSKHWCDFAAEALEFEASA